MTETQPDLEAELRTNGISVESVDAGDPVELVYMTAFPGEELNHGEIGRACNTFIDLAEADRWEPTRVEATVVRAPGDVQGGWHAEAEWFEGLLDYRLSETDFSAKVLDTIVEGDDADGADEGDDADEAEGADDADDADGTDGADETDDADDARTDGRGAGA